MINFNVDSVGSGEDVLQVQSAAGVVHVGGVREVPAHRFGWKLTMMLMGTERGVGDGTL